MSKIDVKSVDTPATPTKSSLAEQISALTSLQASVGWAMIVQVLQTNKAYLERMILDRIDPESEEELSESEVDKVRYKRELTIDLLETPMNLIRYIEEMSEGDQLVDYDPYQKAEELIKK